MDRSTNRFARLGLGLLLLASGSLAARPAASAEVRRISERLIPFAPGGEIHIADKNGKLTVEGWSRREVRIQITRIVRAEDKRKADELMQELQSDVEVRKGRIDIVSRFPKRRESIGIWDILGRKVASLQINYHVQVPKQTDVGLETSNGEIRARELNGQVEASTTNGDIRLTDIKGDVVLTTTNGEVHLNGVSGKATARTTNGSVAAELRGVPSTGKVQLETTNGNVQAYFPDNLKATLEAMTTNGRVSIDYKVTREGVGTAKSIRGTINGGGAKISLTTTNGNVEVRRINERRREKGAP